MESADSEALLITALYKKETTTLTKGYLTVTGKLDNKELLSQAYNALRLMWEFKLHNEE